MIKKIVKKHIKDEHELKVANEIIDNMQFTAEPNTINDFSVKSITIKDFGKHENLTLKFNKVTSIAGDRGKGKSWIFEAFLWCVTGKVRATNKDVIREGAKEATVSVVIQKGESEYEFIRTMKEKANELVINENGAMLTDKIRDGEQIIRAVFGFDLDLLPNLIMFSMKHSALYTKMIPSEVEKHIIRISSLDSFLQLEQRCKDVKKQEQIKIDTYKEMASSSVTMSKEEINEKIKDNKSEIKKLKEEAESIKSGQDDISSIKTRLDEIEKIMSDADKKIEFIAAFDVLAKVILEISDINKKLEALAPEMAKAKEIDAKREKLGGIQQKGKNLTDSISAMKKNAKGNTCPILQRTCTDLETAGKAVVTEIENMENETKKLREQYKELKAEIDNSGYEQITKKISETENELKNKAEEKTNLEKEINGRNRDEIEKELSTINMQDMVDEKEKLNKTVSEATAKQKEINDKIFAVQKKIANAESEITVLKSQLEQIDNAKEITDKKEELESRQVVLNNLINQFGKKGIPKTESQKNIETFNENFSAILEKISGGELQAHFNKDFTLDLTIEGIEKKKSSTVISYGQECLVNMAFMIASSFLLCENVSIVFIDDMMEGQPDSQVESILKNTSKIKNINAFVFASSRIPEEKATLILK